MDARHCTNRTPVQGPCLLDTAGILSVLGLKVEGAAQQHSTTARKAVGHDPRTVRLRSEKALAFPCNVSPVLGHSTC